MPVPQFLIRPICDADVEATIALWQRCELTRPWNDAAQDIAFARSAPNAEILVGTQNSAVAASAMVGHDGHRGVVYYVSVDPAYQGQSYGKQIMAACEDWLRAAGIWKLNLMTRAENERVVGFYKALGYEQEPRINLSKRL